MRDARCGMGGVRPHLASRIPHPAQRQPLHFFGEQVERPVVLRQLAAHPEQRLAADRRPVALVHVGPHDHVHHPRLILEQHEDEPLRRLRPLAGAQRPPCHRSPRRVSPNPSHPPTHTRCSIAGRLSCGGARRTTSPTLRKGPPCSRSVTTAVAVSSLQSRMNARPTRTTPAPLPPSPAFNRPFPWPSTVHHTSLTLTSGSRISIPFRLASRPSASRE